MIDWKTLIGSRQQSLVNKRVILLASKTMNIIPDKTFHVFLSGFSPSLVHVSKKGAKKHAFKSLELILAVWALKSHPLSSK